MTGDDFRQFVDDLVIMGKVRSGYGRQHDVAALLNVSVDSVSRYLKDGTPDMTFDRACSAILAGLPPYPEVPEDPEDE